MFPRSNASGDCIDTDCNGTWLYWEPLYDDNAILIVADTFTCLKCHTAWIEVKEDG